MSFWVADLKGVENLGYSRHENDTQSDGMSDVIEDITEEM